MAAVDVQAAEPALPGLTTAAEAGSSRHQAAEPPRDDQPGVRTARLANPRGNGAGGVAAGRRGGVRHGPFGSMILIGAWLLPP
jgi:hypothetical protein